MCQHSHSDVYAESKNCRWACFTPMAKMAISSRIISVKLDLKVIALWFYNCFWVQVSESSSRRIGKDHIRFQIFKKPVVFFFPKLLKVTERDVYSVTIKLFSKKLKFLSLYNGRKKRKLTFSKLWVEMEKVWETISQRGHQTSKPLTVKWHVTCGVISILSLTSRAKEETPKGKYVFFSNTKKLHTSRSCGSEIPNRDALGSLNTVAPVSNFGEHFSNRHNKSQ